MWEASSSWKERFARLVNAGQNNTSDSSQQLSAEACARRLESHRSGTAASVLAVASVVLMILVIEMIAGFHAIEHYADDILLPEQFDG